MSLGRRLPRQPRCSKESHEPFTADCRKVLEAIWLNPLDWDAATFFDRTSVNFIEASTRILFPGRFTRSPSLRQIARSLFSEINSITGCEWGRTSRL